MLGKISTMPTSKMCQSHRCKSQIAGVAMNEDSFNMSMRKFLKQVGVTSQQEIEKAVRAADAAGNLPNTMRATMTLTLDGVEMTHVVEGTIDTEGTS